MADDVAGALVGALGRYVFGDAAHRIVTGLQDLSHEFDDIEDELRECDSSRCTQRPHASSVSLGEWPKWRK